jgi:hypothetical protein
MGSGVKPVDYANQAALWAGQLYCKGNGLNDMVNFIIEITKNKGVKSEGADRYSTIYMVPISEALLEDLQLFQQQWQQVCKFSSESQE